MNLQPTTAAITTFFYTLFKYTLGHLTSGFFFPFLLAFFSLLILFRSTARNSLYSIHHWHTDASFSLVRLCCNKTGITSEYCIIKKSLGQLLGEYLAWQDTCFNRMRAQHWDSPELYQDTGGLLSKVVHRHRDIKRVFAPFFRLHYITTRDLTRVLVMSGMAQTMTEESGGPSTRYQMEQGCLRTAWTWHS
ncbi:hypothetical protein LZ31DRAFT_292319 [Colletotrichum somersetense]|nr:hypothetical protein LZ31DRAFT_292319 [Colletotrichum somersetense]